MSDSEFLNSITPLEKGIYNFYADGYGKQIIESSKEVMEIGSGWGIFARIALMLNPDIHLTTIDVTKNLPDFEKNTRGLEHRIKRYVGSSRAILRNIPDDAFDMVFVDGNHGYIEARKDLSHALRICKNGGWIVIDDMMHKGNFESDYGVARAVFEMSQMWNFPVSIHPVAHGIAVMKVIKI